MDPKEVLSPSQRCPRCLKQTLSFNPETNTMRCSSCGYEAKLQSGGAGDLRK